MFCKKIKIELLPPQKGRKKKKQPNSAKKGDQQYKDRGSKKCFCRIMILMD